MVLAPYIDVLSAAFLMGFAAAAPMGPVNMLAIRRGVIGGWRHTLACGMGSIAGDLIRFSVVLLGGDYTSFLTCRIRRSGLSWRPRASSSCFHWGSISSSAPSRSLCGPMPALANAGTKAPSAGI